MTVSDIQQRLAEGALTPDMARESLVQLTAILGTLATEMTACDLAYKSVLRDALRAHQAANRAKVEAECSDEYAAFREAKDRYDTVKQLIVTCRGYLRSLDEEMRLQR